MPAKRREHYGYLYDDSRSAGCMVTSPGSPKSIRRHFSTCSGSSRLQLHPRKTNHFNDLTLLRQQNSLKHHSRMGEWNWSNAWLTIAKSNHYVLVSDFPSNVNGIRGATEVYCKLLEEGLCVYISVMYTEDDYIVEKRTGGNIYIEKAVGKAWFFIFVRVSNQG